MSRNIQSFNADNNSSHSNEEEFYLFLCDKEGGDIYDDEIAKNSKDNPWRKPYFSFSENYDKLNKTCRFLKI